MATYPVINKETGEQKDVKLSVHEWTQWLEDNPEWQRDWSDPSTAPGWNDVLHRASKYPGSTVKPV